MLVYRMFYKQKEFNDENITIEKYKHRNRDRVMLWPAVSDYSDPYNELRDVSNEVLAAYPWHVHYV
jgi:hypothetical protein